MALPRPARPSALLADIRRFFGGEHRYRLPVALAAVCMPVIITYGFIKDGNTNIMPGRTITYIQSWPATRTDAEIIAQQKIDQKIREKFQAEKRASFKRLADRLGIE